MNNKEKPKKKPVRRVSFFVTTDEIYEQIYDGEKAKFAVYDRKTEKVDIVDKFDYDGKRYYPYLDKNIIQNKLIRLPSAPEEYESEKDLFQDIRKFIHKYVEVRDIYEELASYYVPFTWIYDNFDILPYLRIAGDFGTGKSRFLQVVGYISYKPMSISGAATSAVIFRLIEKYRGTLVMDEADFGRSDEWEEIIKVLNNGFMRNFPVVRCTGKNDEPTAFDVYCPKIIGMRGRYTDPAAESRFLTEISQTRTRPEIPTILPPEFEEEALRLRNKLLLWRFRNYGKREVKYDMEDPDIEGRLNQIILPLSSVIPEEAKRRVKAFMQEFNQRIADARAYSMGGKILAIIYNLSRTDDKNLISINKIGDAYNADKGGRDIATGKYIGRIVRTNLNIETERRGSNYYLRWDDEKMEKLFKKYNVKEDEIRTMKVPLRTRIRQIFRTSRLAGGRYR